MSVTVPSQQDAGTLITDTLYNEIVDAIAHVLGLKVGEDALSDLSSNAVIVPTGSVMPFAGNSAPTGWLLCDGSAVSRTTYADLYTLIGTTYGVGDGSTTFNLPDLRGRIPGGLDNMGGVSANRITNAQADSLAGNMGAETHTLTGGQIPSHSHDLRFRLANGSGRYITAINGWTFAQDQVFSADPTSPNATASPAFFTGGGSGGAHNNVQPTLFLNYIIKT